MEAAGDHEIDTTDGVRVIERDRGWVLVLPDPADAVTHLWAEGNDADTAQLLLDEWASVVERAGRRKNGRLSRPAGAGGYRQVSWILRLGPRIFALRPGKLCPSRDDAKGANHAEFANVRESRALRFARRSPPAGTGPATGPATGVHGAGARRR